jgi:uncharacterized repeat protein (TIGR03803 family)
MRTFIAVTTALALCLAAGAFAQTYTVLHEFTGEPTDGESPTGGVVSDGAKLYGITAWGGADDEGALYSMNLNGSGFTLLHSFGIPPDGLYPNGGLALDNGVLYGTTEEGGSEGEGTIYSIKTDGSAYAILYSFAPGQWGEKSPVVVSGDMIYGSTRNGGDPEYGTAYSIKTDGTGYTVTHEFAGSPLDGEDPQGALLLENGTLYGATRYGGNYLFEPGTLFSMSPAGSDYTILHNFSGLDGAVPVGGLISDGSRLYGMSGGGGYYYGYTTGGTIFALDNDGANFKTLHTFGASTTLNPSAKKGPIGSLSCTGLARDGSMLYGTTPSIMGITKASRPIGLDPGAIFVLNTDGTGYTELYRFDGIIEGTGSLGKILR